MPSRTIRIATTGPGLHEITSSVQSVIAGSGVRDGLCTLFIRHTSASLLIQENADPAVRHDLESWFRRLVPENDPIYTHAEEGPDDMPAHIKAALTQVSLSIPIDAGRLTLGRWQGIYVWEHRRPANTREVVVHVSQ